MHGPTSLFAISTSNEETGECWVQIWRRKILRGQYGPYSNMILDFKLIHKNFIVLPDPSEEGHKLGILAI